LFRWVPGFVQARAEKVAKYTGNPLGVWTETRGTRNWVEKNQSVLPLIGSLLLDRGRTGASRLLHLGIGSQRGLESA